MLRWGRRDKTTSQITLNKSALQSKTAQGHVTQWKNMVSQRAFFLYEKSTGTDLWSVWGTYGPVLCVYCLKPTGMWHCFHFTPPDPLVNNQNLWIPEDSTQHRGKRKEFWACRMYGFKESHRGTWAGKKPRLWCWGSMCSASEIVVPRCHVQSSRQSHSRSLGSRWWALDCSRFKQQVRSEYAPRTSPGETAAPPARQEDDNALGEQEEEEVMSCRKGTTCRHFYFRHTDAANRFGPVQGERPLELLMYDRRTWSGRCSPCQEFHYYESKFDLH